MTIRVIVVGAGILGLCAAAQLAARGATVTVLDSDYPGSGASGNSFAWVNCRMKRPHNYFNLNAEGVAAHKRLASEAEGDSRWWNPAGSIVLGYDDGLAADHELELAKAWGCDLEWLTRQEIERLEPDLLLREDEHGGVLAPDDGYVYVAELLGELRRRLARAPQNEVRVGTPVRSVYSRNSRPVVEMEDGSSIDGDAVVVAAGRSTAGVLRETGFELPLVGTGEFADNGIQVQRQPLGLLGVTSKIPSSLRRMVVASDIQFRPDGAGRVLVQSHPLELTLPSVMGSGWGTSQAATLLERLRQRLRGITGACVEWKHGGFRVIPKDGMPVVGWVPDNPGVYCLVSHSGVTLGPILGEICASEIVEGSRSPLIIGFEPDRFSSARKQVAHQ